MWNISLLRKYIFLCKFTIYTTVLNEFSEKHLLGAGRFYSRGIFVILNVLCNLDTIHTFYMPYIIHLMHTPYFIHIPYLHFLQCFTQSNDQ